MNRYSVFGILTAALFALLPFATSRHLFHAAVNAKFFLVVAGVLLVSGIAAWALWSGKHSIFLRGRPLLWAGVTLLGLYWLSAIFGVFPERSIFGDILRASGVYFLTHIAVLSLVLGEFLRERDWTLARRTIALSAGVYSFFTLLGTEGLGVSGRIFWTNLDIGGYTFGNTTFAGTFLLLALVITLIELMRTTPKTRWWYALLGSGVLMFFAPILFNSGIFLGKTALTSVLADPMALLGSARASSAAAILLLVFFGGYLAVRRFGGSYKKPTLLAWTALFVVGAFSGLSLLFTPGSIVQEKYIEASTAARILVWQSGFEAFKDRPLLGWGPENFEQAHQWHFDNRLYQDEYIGEVWFDRAHNVIIDTLVNVGILGAIAHLVVAVAFLWTVYRARLREFIGEPEAVLLYALPLAHFLQLQTGFDTIGSYALLGVLGGYALWLERTMSPDASSDVPRDQRTYYKLGASALGLLIAIGAYYAFAEMNRQNAHYRIFVTLDAEKRLEYIETATSRISSFEALRQTSTSLVNGTLARIAEAKLDAQTLQVALVELGVYQDQYRRYIAVQPNHYRARMNLAYLFSVARVLGGENQLEEAKELVARGYELSPGNLLTPTMEALLELYSGNLALAKEKAEEIVALNPDTSFGHNILAHIEAQERTFPSISVLKLDKI